MRCFSNTTGDTNTASGVNALLSNTTGYDNTASGVNALFSNTTGDTNTASGVDALVSNTTGDSNTASGVNALLSNTTGVQNTASGVNALFSNTTGSNNTASGVGALSRQHHGQLQHRQRGQCALRATPRAATTPPSDSVRSSEQHHGRVGNTAIGVPCQCVCCQSEQRYGYRRWMPSSMPAIRSAWETMIVTVIEGQVAFTASSDKTKKENFQPVDGEEVLGKIRGFELSSWNFIGHDPKEFRHYGPMAQDFFAAFGHDGVGQIGTETTINSGDLAGILMIAVQALEKRTAELKQKEAQIAALAARLEALESRQNPSIQITAEKSLGASWST